jgi:hypothetical protein
MQTLLIEADINFGDPIFQFWIGVGSLALSALAIIVSIILAVKGRQRKILTYEVVSNSSVINVENDIGEDLKLVLEGRFVTKVRLHVIKLLNAGNTAIGSEDYPNQLSFEFSSPPYPHTRSFAVQSTAPNRRRCSRPTISRICSRLMLPSKQP